MVINYLYLDNEFSGFGEFRFNDHEPTQEEKQKSNNMFELLFSRNGVNVTYDAKFKKKFNTNSPFNVFFKR